ncbi:coiled-coil domain-containing protein [Wolbachia endosymbiont (group B) of Ischnura elegans]|uniref:hypothetical protein n=1 Tax=Wolbachia endosymbiont (group B) of Ischnura elegans TaxID=2954021 RepID=UPI00222F9D20|nr:hypothetical protein [Wolbachia endosymbiont (group B) of Ischnura elegans]
MLALLYLKTIGRILPGRWNKWAENILHHNKVIVNNGVQTDAPEVVDQSVQISEVVAQEVQSKIISEGKTTFKDTEIQTEFVETEDKNEKLKEQLEGVSQALEVFIGLCNNQAEYIENLQLESDFLKEEKEQLNSLIKKLKESYKELAKVARKRGEEFLVQLKKKSEEILHLQKELIERSKEFANKIEMLSAEIEKKDKKIGSLTELNKALEQKEKEMENKKNEQQQTIFTKDQKIKEQEDLIKSFHENKDINETVKKENENLRVQKTELENEVSKLEDESDAKIKELKNQLEEKQAELEQAKKKNTEVEDLTRELESTQQQLEQEKTNLNTIEKEKKELESEVDKLQEKSQKLEESNVEIKKQKADLEGKLKSSQGENKKLQKQVEHLSAKKTENITTFSTRNNKEIPNQSLTSKDKQTEVSRPESGQQKLKNELKDASKKPEDINKETKAQAKTKEVDKVSTVSIAKSTTYSIISKSLSKLRGNEDLKNFLSKKNEELKKSFPEFKEKHFCHNVLKKTIQSLVYQNGYKFKSDKLLALLEENLVKSGKAIIETKVNKVVEELAKDFVKKHDLKQVIFVERCAEKLYLNEEDSKAILNSFTGFLANRNDNNSDSVKEFIVKELIKAEMKCFSYKIQGLQLASSIRDKFLSPNQGMCNQTQGGVNEYQLTKKAKEKYKLTPNPSMSHTNSTPVSVKQEAMSR